MAVVNTVLDAQTISKVTAINYDVAADAATVADKKSLSSIDNLSTCAGAEAQSKALIKDMTSSITSGITSQANKLMGVVSNVLPKVNIPYKDKLNQFKGALERGKAKFDQYQAAGLKAIDSCGINSSSPQAAFDDIMSKKSQASGLYTSLSPNNLKGLTGQFTTLADSNLSKIVGGNTKTLIQQSLGKGSVSTEQIEEIGKGLITNLGSTGSTAKTKLQVQSFLTGSSKLTNGPTSPSAKITSLTNASVVNSLVGTNPALAAKYMQTTLNSANGTNPNITINGVVDSMVTTLKQPTDSNTEIKLMLLSSINTSIAANDPTQAQLTSVATKGMTDSVINNLGNTNNDSISTSPVSDFTNITNGLSGMDTNWNVDSLNQVNYSVLAGNSRMSGLATNVATTTPVDTSHSFLDGTADTVITDYSSVNIINSCNDFATA